MKAIQWWVLLDKNGKDLIQLTIDFNGPAIRLMDDTGLPRLSLILHKFEKPKVLLADKSQKSFCFAIRL